MAYQKAGYQDALEFDPDKGIIKYGNYEFFADQVGVKPQTSTFNFDAYKQSLAKAQPSMTTSGVQPTDTQLRQQFANDVQAGKLSVNPQFDNATHKLYGSEQSPYRLANNDGGLAAKVSSPLNQAPVAKVNKVDDNTYSVTNYHIPNDIDFVNSLNAKAQQINSSAAQGQVTDTTTVGKPNRLGKANLSRAATVLTDGAVNNNLGAATTALGA